MPSPLLSLVRTSTPLRAPPLGGAEAVKNYATAGALSSSGSSSSSSSICWGGRPLPMMDVVYELAVELVRGQSFLSKRELRGFCKKKVVEAIRGWEIMSVFKCEGEVILEVAGADSAGPPEEREEEDEEPEDEETEQEEGEEEEELTEEEEEERGDEESWDD